MKQNRTAILALLGAASVTKAIRLQKTLDEFREYVSDPQYADTWRFTDTAGNPARSRGGERYVNAAEWEDDQPAGYREGIALQTQTDTNLHSDIPDYWSYDYSGGKHSRWANDPYYAHPAEWVASSPKGYDDTAAQTQADNVLGVTFVPGHVRNHPVEQTAQVETPDYWSYDYSGNKHWGYANDPYFSDP